MTLDWASKPEDIQGTAGWHEWRSKGIGASEAACVMDCNPWKSQWRFVMEKSGQMSPEPAGWAAQRGTRLEPIVRQKFEDHPEIKKLCPPLNNFFPAHSFEKGILRASLDGWNAVTKWAVEIKCPGEKTHQEAAESQMPPIHYWWQIQHQYEVSDAELIYYCSYHLPKEEEDELAGDLIFFPVKKDQDAIEKYKIAATEVWRRVVENDPPPMGDKDWVETDDPTLTKRTQTWMDVTHELGVLKKRQELARDEMLDHVKSKEWTRVKCNGVSISQSAKGWTVRSK